MKKLLSLTAVCLSVFLLASCTQTGTDEPSVPSLPSSSESSQSQSAEDPDSLEIKLTPEILQQNQANLYSCYYMTQDARSYYYRHPIKGTLYRYDKETGRQKELFDQGPTNRGFLYGIQVYEDRIYFCTIAENDQTNTLYSIDRNGGNLTRVLNNIGLGYIFTPDYIYYNANRDPESGIDNTLYQYDRKTGESKRLLNSQCEYLQLVGDYIYYIDWSFTEESFESGSVICRYNLKTGEREVIDVQKGYEKRLVSYEQLLFLDGYLYFRCAQGETGAAETVVLRHNLETGVTEEIIAASEFAEAGLQPSPSIHYYSLVNADEIYTYARALGQVTDYALGKVENGKIEIELKETEKWEDNGYYIGIFDGKPVLAPLEVNGMDFIGLEDLSRTVDDEQAV